MREMPNFLWQVASLPSTVTDSLGQYLFFKLIFDFIDEEIKTFQGNLLNSMLLWISGLALVLVTLWILWQGYRVMQGQARNAMELVIDGGRAALVTTLALTLTLGNASVYTLLTETLPGEITYVMTGERKEASELIDRSMQEMEAAMLAIDVLGAYNATSESVKSDIDRSRWMAGIGVAGPSLVGGALLVTYKMALALFVGFGPLFVLCLLFKQTASLFQKWLLYGVGTMFAQALMAFMSVLVSKVVLATAGAFAAQYAVASATEITPQSVSSMAMLQGGIGLLLTLTLVTIPPMAAYFFQGTLGSYMAYSVFGSNSGAGQRPGEAGYRGSHGPADGRGGPGGQHDGTVEPMTRMHLGSAYGSSAETGLDAIRKGKSAV